MKIYKVINRVFKMEDYTNVTTYIIANNIKEALEIALKERTYIIEIKFISSKVLVGKEIKL